MMASDSLEFQKYLYAISASSTINKTPAKRESSRRQLDTSTKIRLCQAVLDFLASQLKSFHQSLRSLSEDRTSNISKDIIQTLNTASAVTSAIWTRCNGPGLGLSPPPGMYETRKFLADFLSAYKSIDARREMVSEIGAGVLALHEQLYQVSDVTLDNEHREGLEAALSLTRQALSATAPNGVPDFALFDEDQFDSQASQISQVGACTNPLRRDLPICQNVAEMLARQMVQLAVAIQICTARRELDSSTSTVIYAEIVALEPTLLIGARGAVRDFVALQSGTSREAALGLVEKLGTAYLEQEAFERCEPALSFCLQVLQGLVDLWSADEDDDLSAASLEIYDWFLSIALEKEIVSPRVLSVLAELLDTLLRKNISCGGDNIPSTRTSLLKILEVSDPVNQHRMAEKISHIFEKYILTQHDAIFDDIVGKLPHDIDKIEGIAVRLFVVSRLGARWNTVLRQAVYNIFEPCSRLYSPHLHNTGPQAT
jgi:serine-protein kinase ATM